MPDADKVHAKLCGSHRGVYKKICEDHFSEEDLAHDELRAIIKDVGCYGDEPLQLIRKAVAVLNQIPTGPLFLNNSAINWAVIRRQLETIAQTHSSLTTSSQIGIDLALRSCQEFLHDIRYGIVVGNIEEAKVIRNYLVNVYKANFEERIQLSRHYNDADPNFVAARVEGMRPYIEKDIQFIAQQIERKGSVRSLRRPAKVKQPVELSENLLG
jgi:hypothetical protein